MKDKRKSVSPGFGLVQYDPGDALGSPVETTIEKALSYWVHDTAYLQTLLDCTVVSAVKRWPTIRCEGQELPGWKVCRMVTPEA